MSNTGMKLFSLNGEEIEIVIHFNLLGSELDNRGTCKMDLDRRLTLGRAAMMGLTKIWKDKDIKSSTKVR